MVFTSEPWRVVVSSFHGSPGLSLDIFPIKQVVFKYLEDGMSKNMGQQTGNDGII